jgi:RND family efflux transporter MFP subunit
VDSTQAKALLETADAMYAQAQDGYKRLKPLHEKGGISDVKWIEMETNLEKAHSLLISSRRRFEDCSIIATQDGVVTMNDVNVGQQVAIGQPIGKLMDLSAYCVEFTVPESEIGSLKVGQQITVSLPALSSQYNAKISEKALSSTHLAHTYRVKAEITSPSAAQDLLPGMICRAIITQREHNGFIISAGCIQTQQRGHSVWVLREGHAERQMVKIEAFVENGVLISEGIELGDTVIAKGYQKMYKGARVIF